MTVSTKVALYARVSTDDKGQDPTNQLHALREHCALEGYEPIEYVDYDSGRKSDRPQFKRLLADAARWQFKLVLAWKLDRFSREGVAATFRHLEHLKKCGVAFRSLTEPFIDTDSPFADVLLAVMAWCAEQESKRLSQRVKAGLARRRSGQKSATVESSQSVLASGRRGRRAAAQGHRAATSAAVRSLMAVLVGNMMVLSAVDGALNQKNLPGSLPLVRSLQWPSRANTPAPTATSSNQSPARPK